MKRIFEALIFIGLIAVIGIAGTYEREIITEWQFWLLGLTACAISIISFYAAKKGEK